MMYPHWGMGVMGDFWTILSYLYASEESSGTSLTSQNPSEAVGHPEGLQKALNKDLPLFEREPCGEFCKGVAG